MGSEKRDFDQAAASWDERPQRVKLAKDVADAVIRLGGVQPTMDVLDFGCGTGLLTLQLQPLVHSITGVDSSRGMLEILNGKISGRKLANARTVLCDLDNGDLLPGKYDLVVSSMTMHHIPEIAPLLAHFYQVLAPGGCLCVADLDDEGGRFHGDNTGVFHFGFQRDVLRGWFAEAGFVDVVDDTAAEIVKDDDAGAPARFSVFLMIGRKG
jgi:ubiquinone/menaquinone biosynthesis C-methylase UbiE